MSSEIPSEQGRILQAVYDLAVSGQFKAVPFFVVKLLQGCDEPELLQALTGLIARGCLQETTAEALSQQVELRDGGLTVNIGAWPPTGQYTLSPGRWIDLRWEKGKPVDAKAGDPVVWQIEASNPAVVPVVWRSVAVIIGDTVAGSGGRLFQLTDQGREALRQAWAQQEADVRTSARALADWLRAHSLSGGSKRTLARRAVSEASERIVELFNKAALAWANLQRESKDWLKMLLDVLGVQTLEEGMVGCFVEACLTGHKHSPANVLSAQALADDAAKLADFLDTLDRLAGIQKPNGQEADERRASGLLERDVRILRRLAENPLETRLLVDIAAASGTGCRDTVGKRIKTLKAKGLVQQPNGPRGGWGITLQGLAVLKGEPT